MINLIFIFLAAIFTRLPSFFTAFYNPDETCYATIGARLLEGKRLYIDIIDHKPPLIYYIYAFFNYISSGNTIIAAHVAVAIIIAATALVIAAIVKQLDRQTNKRELPLLAALLYVIGASLGKPNDVMAANAELIFNLPLSLYIFFLVRNASARSLMLAGFFAGLAILIKPHAITALLVGVVACGRKIFDDVILCIGVLIPIVLTAIWLWWGGQLDAAWYWGVTVNSLYMQGHEGGLGLLLRFAKQTLYMFAEEAGLWLPAIFALLLRKKLGPSLIFWWLFSSALALIPGWRFFGHYYLQMLPSLAILSAYAGYGIVSSVSWKRAAVTVWCLLLAAPLLHSWIWAWHIENEPEENRELIGFLKANTLPAEKIEVWGRFNGISFLTGRENGTRFLNKNLLSGSFRRDELVKMPEKHWELYFNDLEKNRPEWFIDHSAVDMKGAPVAKFPRLAEYISKNYHLAAEVEGNLILKRN